MADGGPAARWGVAAGYHDVGGRWITPGPESVARALAAMRADGSGPPEPEVVCANPWRPLERVEAEELITEDGALLPAGSWTRERLPLGYHTLRRLRDGRETRLIVSPGACPLPEGLRAWGWAVQLYALRSAASWGAGDLADLRALARWSRELGAGALMLNPLHAALPLLPQEPSPYSPSSRRFRNPLYIRVDEVPGAERLGDRLAPLAAAGRDIGRRRRIDRDGAFRLKMRALEEIFAASAEPEELAGYREREGRGLRDYATFCALCERHGSPWRDWPRGLRHPDSPEVAAFRLAASGRVRFHEWLQWLLDRQLAAAAAELPLIHDLAIGATWDGADAWAWQETLAAGVRVGAPPDPFNAAGQDWGLPPYDPWRLRAAGYEPFAETVRAAFRHGAGLRLDHVMGLFRLFWIPDGAEPSEGVYVNYPHEDLLDVLALESHRAGAFVVGEDLGTVEDRVRGELARRRVLSYRLLWFEDRPPADYPADSMAALTTHDLPTLAGVWEGSDGDPGVRERLLRYAGATEGEATSAVSEAAHRALAQSPSRLLMATLEDALEVAERPNRPGTDGNERPNWSLPLPLTLEEMERDPRPRRLAGCLHRP